MESFVHHNEQVRQCQSQLGRNIQAHVEDGRIVFEQVMEAEVV
jgi:hypothetical protein